MRQYNYESKSDKTVAALSRIQTTGYTASGDFTGPTAREKRKERRLSVYFR